MIVIDIDGVLADASHRQHLLQGRPNWQAFFDAAADDQPIDQGRTALISSLNTDEVTLLTGRPERLRELTVDWLERHNFPNTAILMRSDRDHRKAAIFKEEALALLGGPTVVRLVIDDDPAVIARLTASGYVAKHFVPR